MNNLKHLLTRPLRAVPNSLVIFVLIIALIGFADSTYLVIEHYQGVIPPCSIIGGCELVLTSVYASIIGIPVSLLGAIYYFIILVGSFAYLDTKKTEILKWTMLFTVFGILASPWFVFLQVFIIKSYCVYCLGSVITSTILFVMACVIFKRYSDEEIIL